MSFRRCTRVPEQGLGVGLVLVILALFLGVVAVVLNLYGRSYRSFERGSNRVDLINEARRAWNVVGATLRTAQPSVDGLAAVVKPDLTDREASSFITFHSRQDLLDVDVDSGLYRLRPRKNDSGGLSLVLEDPAGEHRKVLVERIEKCSFRRESRGAIAVEMGFSQGELSFNCEGVIVLPGFVDGP